ncbi:lipoate--protein ligase family protein [Lactiplantibacillus plantarum]|uniref:lipoate--protein ligase family protein n=1 Tax=Lactiplantibacillus plantarum TaxID=1590 RepID=UPI0007871019|nr:lipoate--protein ligase family protein [Lactiplantibacillus plantarum]KYK52980.1 lipoate--protein ligase [Lactiplantibacillus plantarum]KYM70277.1 lipoate--protein ligase [Lactiplantibacillus plantarum]MBU7471988.1 lipoate--protein ligase family protein [Lactiplantibacillus plantarum]MBX4157931.1 lipoate--protein ligase family protein [Lactiplantibacillus plantarum]MDV9115675.1 lipoate--protein ligase family protein [Lactiplantibacillus plantarum]
MSKPMQRYHFSSIISDDTDNGGGFIMRHPSCPITTDNGVAFLTESTIATLSQKYEPAAMLDSFAYTNALLWLTAARQQPIVHFWQLQPTVILGLLDQRLPRLTAGLAHLHAAGYQVMLRNSGGLAVIADPGVLNVSLFLPATRERYSITAAYQLMVDYVQAVWPQLNITTGEITRSYCPGDYDLSIAGRKIAGMSQRRTAEALVIMLYVSVDGDQMARSQLIQRFYQVSLAGHHDARFPDVDPQVMTTVADALAAPTDTTATQARFIAILAQHGTVDTTSLPLVTEEPEFQAHLNQAYQQMQRRQQRLHH